jgi:hypothetical protein
MEMQKDEKKIEEQTERQTNTVGFLSKTETIRFCVDPG